MTARTHLPEAEEWLAQLPADLRRAAAIADPDSRAIVLGDAHLHASWLMEALDREAEECRHQADRYGVMPTAPRLRIVGRDG